MPARIQPSTSNDAFSFHAGPIWFDRLWQEALRTEGLAPYKVVLWHNLGAPAPLGLQQCQWIAGFSHCMSSHQEVMWTTSTLVRFLHGLC